MGVRIRNHSFFALLWLALGLVASGMPAEASSGGVGPSQVLRVGKTMQISFDPKQWFYHQPTFMADAKIGVFEGQKLNDVHAFLHTDPFVTAKPELAELCKVLENQPLDPNSKSPSKLEALNISGAEACKVTKSDSGRNAVQYVFISKKDLKSLRQPSSIVTTRYYVHYLYFYYPKKVSADAEPLIAGLVKGIGYKK